ncbi:MAG TPA: GNAT family N-acetyltransferase [Tepidisphaeraceae bacterium]|nr:GNAT family N-acetyltransferase [Tepidisphaeraceae bacterium]
MPDDPTPLPDIPVTIRAYRGSDAAAVRALYTDGVIPGRVEAGNDTAADMDDVATAYAGADGNGFWVAENAAGQVVGMIGVQNCDADEAEVRRLRVRLDHQRRGIGSKLLETALAFCTERGYLKVKLDTHVGRVPAIKLFEKFRFRHDRTRSINGRELKYFYLDLYRRDERARD